MVVFVEAVLLDNLVIDAVLLWLVLLTLRLKVNVTGLILASIFGAGFALTSPLLSFGGILGFLIKIVVAIIMCVMLCLNFKKIFYNFVLFVIYTFAFGGLLIAVFNFLSVPTVSGLNVGYVSNYPLGAIFALLLLFVVLMFLMIKKHHKVKKFDSLCKNVLLKINNKSNLVQGFCDSGNVLESSNGRPVLVLNPNSLNRWFNAQDELKLFLNKPFDSLSNCETITINSACGSEKMLLFEAQSCIIDGIDYEVMIGVSKKQIGNFDLILNSKLVV